MKKIKKIFATFLVVVFTMTLVPTTAFASSNTAINGVQAELNKILSEYPNGSYFSVNGKACTHKSGSTCNNCSLYGIMNAKNLKIPQGQGKSWTCMAFSTYVFTQVFDTKLKRGETMNLVAEGPLNKASTYTNAKPGDIILFYPSSQSGLTNYKHMAVFMGTTSTGVTLYDSNVGGTNKVHYGTVSYENIINYYTSSTKKTYCRIYHAKNYDKINGIQTTSNITSSQPLTSTSTSKTTTNSTTTASVPKTKLLINTSAVLKNGSKGTQVKYLQMNLNAMNYSCGTADGAYGNNTKKAVLQFQKAEGLTQDGIAGPATLKRMAEITTKTQIDLYKLGYYKGNIDGVLGSGTRTAIKNFQKEYNYYQSSLATLAVRNALTKAVNEK